MTWPSSCTLIPTTAVPRAEYGRFVKTGLGGCAITVTPGPGPGCHALLAAGVRYSRATAWLASKSALARMKFSTICSGPQPGAGGFMISPQQSEPRCTPPLPDGRLVVCSSPLVGTAAQPAARTTVTSAPASARPAARACRRPRAGVAGGAGRGLGSGIAARLPARARARRGSRLRPGEWRRRRRVHHQRHRRPEEFGAGLSLIGAEREG